MEPTLQQATVVHYAGDRCEAGQFHGRGKAVFSSGPEYDGDWQQGHMDGFGRLSFPDGVQYDGSIIFDRITGKGVYSWANAVYEGELLNGLRHGYGTLRFTDSHVVYEGEWQYGKRHGRGVLYYDALRSSYFEGDWQDDMKHGQGISVYPSGNSYTGSWAFDRREGPGTMAWFNHGQVYSGMWVKNMPNGLGEHVWQQGVPSLQVANHATHVMYNRYFGMFKDGQRHGEGALWYSSGARYEGQWEHDRKQGSGAYVFEDGTVFAGQFAADRPVLQAGAMFTAASTLPCEPPLSVEPGLVTDSGSAASDAENLAERSPPAASPAGDAATAKRASSTAGSRTADAGSIAASGDAAPAADSGRGGVVQEGPPGFGPRISSHQLYIGDLLEECDSPAATYKAVSNLLTGCNTELRALYDRYCHRLSPLIDSSATRNSWALQAGQLWELLRDSQLLCRHVYKLLQQSLQPPPPVAERRLQVLSTPDAAAVLTQPEQPYEPTTELLYRDFCELLVRLSAMRYPQLSSLDQKLQQVLVQHLLPLVGGGQGRQGGGRQSMQLRASLMHLTSGAGLSNSSSSIAVAPAAVGPAAGAGPEQVMQQEGLALYLQSQAEPLQQLFAACTSGCCRPSTEAAVDGEWHHEWPGDSSYGHQQHQVQGVQEKQAFPHASLSAGQAVTVRQVVAALRHAGVLQQWQMDASAVAAVLLEGALGVADPAGLRARLDEANMEADSTDTQQQASDEAATAAAAQQELLYWMDAPLLLAELLWGLVRCAALVQPEQLNPQQEPHQQQQKYHTLPSATVTGEGQPLDYLGRVQALLQGPTGLYYMVLGRDAYSEHDNVKRHAEQLLEGAAVEQQQQQQQHQNYEPEEANSTAYHAAELNLPGPQELRPATGLSTASRDTACTAISPRGLTHPASDPQ